MQGMTLKKLALRRFFDLIEALKEAKLHIDTPEGKHAFVLLSVQVHAAKADVPKRLWTLVNRA